MELHQGESPRRGRPAAPPRPRLGSARPRLGPASTSPPPAPSQKFLVDHNGVPRKRFSPPRHPLELREEIERMLDAADAAKDKI